VAIPAKTKITLGFQPFAYYILSPVTGSRFFVINLKLEDYETEI